MPDSRRTARRTAKSPDQRARKNHDGLFPGHVSTLAVSDPEFVEIFDNFVFDEVLRHGNLDARTRLMVQLASMVASQALGEFRVMPGAAGHRSELEALALAIGPRCLH